MQLLGEEGPWDTDTVSVTHKNRSRIGLLRAALNAPCVCEMEGAGAPLRSLDWPKLLTLIATAGLIPALLLQNAPPQSVTLTVDAGRVLREGADHFVGINLNYIRDLDANRPKARPLEDALKDLGVRWLRFPGGGKSDYHLWSEPPYDKPNPASLKWYAQQAGVRMDFDQYMAVVRSVGAEPYIVVGYGKEASTGRTKAQWLENAVAWVRYANVVKKYGVKYWEIGNENWNNNKGGPTELAQIVTEFSRAMKAIDPTIQVGASGNSDAWWSEFLPAAAPSLDFISLSHYDCWEWKSYDRFTQQPTPDLLGGITTALKAIDRYAPVADRGRLRVIVAEINSEDFSKDGWLGANTLGHALVTFDTLGRVMEQNRVLSAMVWTTRWMNDAEAWTSQWYALGPANEILPTGRAIALWGQFIQSEMVAVMGDQGTLTAYASRSEDGQKMSIWLLNRGYQPAKNVRVLVKSPTQYHEGVLYRLSGTDPDDANPNWGPIGRATLTTNTVDALLCPPVSVTVISLR